eukprot:jgi/Chlat1/6784/Chrsp50S06456
MAPEPAAAAGAGADGPVLSPVSAAARGGVAVSPSSPLAVGPVVVSEIDWSGGGDGGWVERCHLWRTGELCDVALRAGDVEVRASRSDLALASRYFRSLFLGSECPPNGATVHLAGVSGPALEMLVTAIYERRLEMDLSLEQVESLLAAAHRLDVPQVKAACALYLTSLLSPGTCLVVRSAAARYSLPTLSQAAENIALDHFAEVARTPTFLTLSLNEVASLVRSDALHVDSELQVFEAVARWTRYDLARRSRLLPELLSLVRLALISPHDLMEHVAAHPIVRKDLAATGVVLDAIAAHAAPTRRKRLLVRPRGRTKTSLAFEVEGWFSCTARYLSSRSFKAIDMQCWGRQAGLEADPAPIFALYLGFVSPLQIAKQNFCAMFNMCLLGWSAATSFILPTRTLFHYLWPLPLLPISPSKTGLNAVE